MINNDTNASMHAKVQVINGGEWLFQEDFSPSRSYLPDDYDQTEPIKQWESQPPLGHQFILQLESGNFAIYFIVGEGIHSVLWGY